MFYVTAVSSLKCFPDMRKGIMLKLEHSDTEKLHQNILFGNLIFRDGKHPDVN